MELLKKITGIFESKYSKNMDKSEYNKIYMRGYNKGMRTAQKNLGAAAPTVANRKIGRRVTLVRNGENVGTFDTQAQAAEFLGVSSASISRGVRENRTVSGHRVVADQQMSTHSWYQP